jgi:hypothetical protein
MSYHITCKCGHPIGHHNDGGCEGGERLRRCTCQRDRMQALDYALNVARSRSRMREARIA